MVKFVADSSCDVTELMGANFEAVPLTISTDEKSYIDDPNIDIHDMLDYLAAYNDRSYTACPSTERWMAAFEGADEIYVATVTGCISGTYNSACLARDLYLEDHPDTRILVVDSLSTGPELRMIVEKMIEMKQSGMTFEQISAEIPSYVKSTKLVFAFQSLHNLAQNGRVNKVVAGAIGMLGITITGRASEIGTVEPTGKCRGEKRVIRTLLEDMKKEGWMGGKIRICHIENQALAEKIAQAIRKEYEFASQMASLAPAAGGNTSYEVMPDLDLEIYPAMGLVSYYGERGGICIGYETAGNI